MTDIALLRTIVKPRHRPATEEELALFEVTCARTGLDPLARQVYAQFRSDSRTGKETMAIQATIDGFRVIAERSGDYLGGDSPQWCGTDGEWKDVWLSDVHPVAARITIHKSVGGQVGDTTVVAHWKEYAPTGNAAQMWTKMPALMLAKVAEALALRRAFPMVLSGIYTSEEMAQATPVESVAETSQGRGRASGPESVSGASDPPVASPVETDPEAVAALKAVCKEAKFNWAVIKECYGRAELTPPYAFVDVFTGLTDEDASVLIRTLRDRAVEFSTDVPYSAGEVAPDAPVDSSDVFDPPSAGNGDDGMTTQPERPLDAAPQEPTPLLAGEAPIDAELALSPEEQEALLTNDEAPEPAPVPRLTEADLLVVAALKRGDCKRAKVAEILGVTPEVAGLAVAELKAKLGVRSGQAVIELAERSQD